MGTFLFSDIIFGPVQSRRLGVSLGINILPVGKKFCNFNCVYCECGLNPTQPGYMLPSREEVRANLIEYLQSNDQPDAITFAGNGEPTIHPEFAGIIEDTIAARNTYSPNAKVVVLSNATMLHQKHVMMALNKVDQNIQKLDSVFSETRAVLNQPGKTLPTNTLIEQLQAFQGNVIIQTLFIKGEYNGKYFDNTTQKEVDGLIDAYKKINPQYVMVYGISRDTPIQTLEKIDKNTLEKIGLSIEKENISVKISY